jgi:hypothetical protein
LFLAATSFLNPSDVRPNTFLLYARCSALQRLLFQFLNCWYSFLSRIFLIDDQNIIARPCPESPIRPLLPLTRSALRRSLLSLYV